MRRRRHIRTAWIAALASASVLTGALQPATAGAADTAAALIHECATTGGIANPAAYSVSVYKQALASLPADVAEYTNCYDVISQARLERIAAAAHNVAGGGSSGGPIAPIGAIGGSGRPGGTPQTSAEYNAVQRAVAGHPNLPTPGDSRLAPLLSIDPTALHHRIATPIIVVLVLLGCGALLIAGRLLAPHVQHRLRG